MRGLKYGLSCVLFMYIFVLKSCSSLSLAPQLYVRSRCHFIPHFSHKLFSRDTYAHTVRPANEFPLS